jgi:hypothetical protein
MYQEDNKDMNHTDLPEARGCVVYDKSLGVLSDCHSPVAVGAWDTDQIGITQFFLKACSVGTAAPLLRPLVRLFLDLGQGWEPVSVTDRRAWPGGWEEVGMIRELQVCQQVWFAANDELIVEWSFDVPRDIALRVAVQGGSSPCQAMISGERNDQGWALRFVSPHKDFSGKTDVVIDLCATPSWPVASVGFTGEAAIPSLPLGDRTLQATLPGGKHGAYWCEFAPTSGRDAKLRLSWKWQFNGQPTGAAVSKREHMSDALVSWQETFAGLPACEPSTDFWRRKYWQAMTDILTCSVKVPAGYGNFEDLMAVTAAPVQSLSTAYFWDSMVVVPALGLIDPSWSVEIIENFTRKMEHSDLAPPYMNAFPQMRKGMRWMGSQAPIASWALAKLQQCGKADVPFDKVYSSLRLLNERWFACADHDRDGMPEWRATGAVADDSPLYDQYRNHDKATCFYLLPHKSVSLSSYLLMDMRCLRKMAETLGKHEDVLHWDTRIDEFEALMLEHLWHPDEAIFYDRDTTTGQPTKVKTFFNLLPLWAGIRLPERNIKAAIERHLLNPDEMWGPIPFPSVAYNETTYDPNGYWRGRTWPHVYLWNTEILARYGYIDEANEAKRRFLAMVADGQQICECYASDLNHRENNGLPHYTFGTGALVQFLLNWHLQPI